MTQQNGRTEGQTITDILNTMLETQVAMLRASRALADEVQESPTEFSIPFRAFFRLGDLVRVIRQGNVNDVVIRQVTQFPSLFHDDGQKTADALGVEVTNLEMGTGAMAQLRFSPMDVFKAEIDNPQGVEQWRASSTRFQVLPYMISQSGDYEKQVNEVMSQFWVWENQTPRFNMRQIMSLQYEGYLKFWGWKYLFTLSSQLQEPERSQVEARFARGDFRVFRLNGRPG